MVSYRSGPNLNRDPISRTASAGPVNILYIKPSHITSPILARRTDWRVAAMVGEQSGQIYDWSLAVPFIMLKRTFQSTDRIYARYVAYMIGLLLSWTIFLPIIIEHKAILFILSLCSASSLALNIPTFVWFAVIFLTGNSPEKGRSLFYYLFSWIGGVMSMTLVMYFWSHSAHGTNDFLKIFKISLRISFFLNYNISAFAVGQYVKNLVDYRVKGFPASPVRAAPDHDTSRNGTSHP